MKVLVTGASGLLGRYLARSVPDGVEAEFTWATAWQPWCRHQLDVADASQVGYVFAKVKPDAVVHMAGVGSVDWCEANYRTAWAVNVGGTKNVLAQRVPAMLTSTNAVYSGEDPPYAEDAPREPVNAYGITRRHAEDAVLEAGGSAVRLFLLYGWEPPGARGNWASSAARRLAAGERLRVVDDVFYQPTYAADAAEVIWKALSGVEQRQINVAGEDRVSLFTFITQLARSFGAYENLVEPCSIREFPSLAPRPGDTTYDLSLARQLGLSCRGIEEGLEAMYWEGGRRERL